MAPTEPSSPIITSSPQNVSSPYPYTEPDAACTAESTSNQLSISTASDRQL